MAYYPIYKASEYNLRAQIMNALEDIHNRITSITTVGSWPVLKNSVDTGEYVIIPAGHQMICYEAFTQNGGTLEVIGQLVVLGGDNDSDTPIVWQ